MKEYIRPLHGFWLASLLPLIVALGLALYFYRLKFGGGLSGVSSDWSNFGSYIGGIFGPLVSFVTLVAVLKTVFLQRELLNAQQKEFDRMNELQTRTFESQQLQVERSARDSLVVQIAAAQESAVRLIEMRMHMHERDFDRQHDLSFRYRAEFEANMTEEQYEKLKRMVDHRNKARESVDCLSKVALDISLAEFQSVMEVREFLAEGIKAVYEKLDQAYPGTLKQIL